MHSVENCLKSEKFARFLWHSGPKALFTKLSAGHVKEKFSPVAGNLTCPEIDNCFSHLMQVFKILLACGELQNLIFFSFVEN